MKIRGSYGREVFRRKLKKNVEQIVKAKIEKEMSEEVEKFANRLNARKDDYISEVMKGIRIYHERDARSRGINYKVIFENVVRLEKE